MTKKLIKSIVIPKKFKGKNVNRIIEIAKKEYFDKKLLNEFKNLV